ncbi:tRNA (guanine(37)-N1)-methyltransferase 1-like [Salvia miltiorrhiza]|uniref:tRNA (guanine(37)-N1)-methyltransferase 1-like n=1 Tax=Salvia miltiorrhiza TaxID=226208 RepID=UPI0025AB68A4|nr:tRNA (guanine(37)-N1)-methyltransferase 1-like [Salvia miltiorrhiza]
MATKFSLFRPRPLPPITLFPAAKPRFVAALSCGGNAVPSFSYGPSLQKGHSPLPLELPRCPSFAGENVASLDEATFTRVFDISALRVPSAICSALENRLRGHLLNWPRIRNIARVSGDEIDEEIKTLLPQSASGAEAEGEALVALNRRIYGKAEWDGEPLNAVLYRDKLARTFNSQGYASFRNLARISRPKKGKTRDDGEKRAMKGVRRSEGALVEVVEFHDSEDLSGLLGEDAPQQQKWLGPTRLLLLDERYSNKSIEELPQAIKVVFEEDDRQHTESAFELVKCKLTLFYDYWQLSEILEALLPKGMTVPSAFETVGHIAHLNLRDEHRQYKSLIAKVVLDKNKPKIQTVVNKVDFIQNNYRTMQLEVLAGNNSLVTTVVENGLRFHVDLAAVYWNSRLATERQRLLNCFTDRDVVCDVFAGVGPIAISAAKKVKYVYANDLNPCAVEYLEKNCVLNKLERKIQVFNMDGRRFIETVFRCQKAPITQVVMNLPQDAAEFLDCFRGLFHGLGLGKGCTLPRIHVYGFSKAQDPEFDFHERIRIALSEVAFDVQMQRVRLVAPGKWMLCASFVLPDRVAFYRRG